MADDQKYYERKRAVIQAMLHGDLEYFKQSAKKNEFCGQWEFEHALNFGQPDIAKWIYDTNGGIDSEVTQNPIVITDAILDRGFSRRNSKLTPYFLSEKRPKREGDLLPSECLLTMLRKLKTMDDIDLYVDPSVMQLLIKETMAIPEVTQVLVQKIAKAKAAEVKAVPASPQAKDAGANADDQLGSPASNAVAVGARDSDNPLHKQPPSSQPQAQQPATPPDGPKAI